MHCGDDKGGIYSILTFVWFVLAAFWVADVHLQHKNYPYTFYMVIISARWCYFFSLFTGFHKTAKAVTVFPFIFVRSKDEIIPWIITHERIHIRQQIELLLIGAVLLYIIETLYSLLVLRLPWYEAYLWNSNEQESYRNQNNPDYLKNRKPFSQFHYLMNKRKFTHKDGAVTYSD